MENKFYLHINSVNLAHYFGCACIKPSKYFASRSVDFQSTFLDYLLLSRAKSSINSDCSVELILTKDEVSHLLAAQSNDDFFFFPFPIPISRVSSVYFETEELKDKTSTLINLSTAFIPKNILKTFQNEKPIEIEKIILPSVDKTPDFSEELKKYNSILGGFAIMKLAREPYMNFSDNYFSTLSFFNSAIEEDISKSRKVATIYHDVFIGKDSFKSLKPFLEKVISEDDLNSIAKNENQKIKKDVITGLIDFNSLDRATYIIAVLYSFGVGDEGRKSKVDGLILDNFHKNIKIDKSEVIALCYGLNRGYSVFNNKYRNESNEQLVKFELNSKLDYYTIESIYQYAINSANSNSFQYLDSIIPTDDIKNKKQSKSDYYILDKLVITERIRVGDPKWWSRFLNFFFQKNQEELFKPFLLQAFTKIKEDLEDEFSLEIENKNSEIQLLKDKNSDLTQKLKNIELNEIKVSKEKEKHKELVTTESTLQETTVDYSVAKETSKETTEEELIELKEKIRDYQRLLKSIGKQTAMPKAKELIGNFYKQNQVNNDELFNN
ncbi:MAG: hypothetical protein ACKVOU_13660 [Cytophagales bacterium]